MAGRHTRIFPTFVVQIIQRDAFERLNLKSLTRETAGAVVRKVVDALLALLEHTTTEVLRGALNRSQRPRRPGRSGGGSVWRATGRRHGYQCGAGFLRTQDRASSKKLT
jgi:hypothetical protein